MKKNIGIIDSGIGGLSILSEFMQRTESFNFFYISDESNVPYGGKSQAFMLERVQSMVDKLKEKNVDIIVLACNTLTVETISSLRQSNTIQFYGIEPYINYIQSNTYDSSKTYGLILTEATFASEQFKKLRNKCDPKAQIKTTPLKNLAQSIQKLKVQKYSEVKVEIEKELRPLKEQNLDMLILGCTHYPLIKNEIENYLNVKTTDPHSIVINYVLSKIDQRDFSKENVKNFCEMNFQYNSQNKIWIETNLNSFTNLNFGQ